MNKGQGTRNIEAHLGTVTVHSRFIGMADDNCSYLPTPAVRRTVVSWSNRGPTSPLPCPPTFRDPVRGRKTQKGHRPLAVFEALSRSGREGPTTVHEQLWV